MEKRIIIAVDGFSSSGKSTMAKRLARQVGYAYIDTGAMYRAVTLYGLDNGLIGDSGIDERALAQQLDRISITFEVNPSTGASETCLNGVNVESEIRQMRVSSLVSSVAAIPAVRRALVAQQQLMGRGKGIVMDGRDIGTVVFPEAEMKVFVTADVAVRARRRFNELQAKGNSTVTYEQVLRNVEERDRLDLTRTESPLRQAPDAIVLDNSAMTLEEQDQWLMALYNSITGNSTSKQQAYGNSGD